MDGPAKRSTPNPGGSVWWLVLPGVLGWLHSAPLFDPLRAILPMSERMFFLWLETAFVIGAMLALASLLCGLAAARGSRSSRSNADRRAGFLIAIFDFTYMLWYGALAIALLPLL